MKKTILLYLLAGLLLNDAKANSYTYTDYIKIRNEFDESSLSLNYEIEKTNKSYIAALNEYQKCNSNKWRSAFISVIPEIDEKRSILDKHKQDAYNRAREQNLEILKIAKENNITKIQADDDISEFVIWYRTQTSSITLDPYHDLQIYIEGYKQITDSYSKMAFSCKNDSTENINPEIIADGIKSLLQGIIDLIKK